MTEAASHDKEMKDLMSPELCREVVENPEFQSVNDAADGVDNTSRQKPCKGSFGQCVHQRAEDKNAGPPHGNVDQGTYPVRAVDKIYLQNDAQNSCTPYKDQQGDPLGSFESQKTYRRVGPRNQHKDHGVVNPA